MLRELIFTINTTEAITDEDYKQVELIGWLYQFYISDRKDEVFAGFKNNKKARPEDIPAATQIFTPKWIVKYMVENTVGKIWLDYNPASPIREEMKYLVENEGSGVRDQGSGESLIADITELTLMDPACGSGHILVEGFDLMMKMYLEEGYTKKSAVFSILENNLYGLEIDDRAAQLARFALLLKAASYYPEIINLPLSETKKEGCNIHAFPEPRTFTTDELLTVIGQEGKPFLNEIKEALDLLQQGKNIGSALKLNLREEVLKFIEELLRKDHSSLVWQQLKPFLEIIISLSGRYYAVAANPPYMGQKSMNARLKDYINTHYPLTKADLFAVFMEVCLNLNVTKGLMGMINQHSWMFLSSYEKLREEIINNYGIMNMLHLGPRTFEELSGEVVQSTAFVLKNGKEIKHGTYYRLINFRNNAEKEINFLKGNNRYPNIPQTNFSKIPGSPIAYWLSKSSMNVFDNDVIADTFITSIGLSTGENDKYVRFWFEANNQMIAKSNENKSWVIYSKGGSGRKWYGNKEFIVYWFNNGFEIKQLENSVVRNEKQYFKESIQWSRISSGSLCVRYNDTKSIFDVNSASLFYKTKEDRDYLLGLLNSNVSEFFLKIFSPTLTFQIGDVSKIPYIKNENINLSINIESCINISRKDWDSQETSWDFEKSPLLNENTSLNRAYQNWRESVIQDFFRLRANEKELNRIFIDIYELQEELTPNVSLKDITILKDEIDHAALKKLEKTFREKGKEAIQLPIKKDIVISQFLSYCIGLMLGRYRLDKPGLNIAHPNPTEEELLNYKVLSPLEGGTRGVTIEIDDDAIIPFMGSESAFPDDVVSRVKNLLIAIWGEETLTGNLNFIRECLGMDMERWLTEKFWPFHVRMYKKRPIYWLFTSNIKKPNSAAFKVLVYMHRLDKYTVQKIRNNYLHPHQGWIKREIEKLKEDEASLSREDQKRLTKLQQLELECRDYDEVLKGLANQQIEIDLDDGVKVNIEKFEPAVAEI